MREANGPIVDAFRFAVAQDGAHELFANVFAFEAGTQARAQSVVAFAVLGGNAARCGGYRFCCRSARGGCGSHRCTRFRCSGLRCTRLGSCGCARQGLGKHEQLFNRCLLARYCRMGSFCGFGSLLAGTQALQVLFDARRSVSQRGLAEHTGGGRAGSRCCRLGSHRLRHSRLECCRFRCSGLGRCGSNRGGRRNRLFCSRLHSCFFRHAGSRCGCLGRAGGKERGGRCGLRCCGLGRNRSAHFRVLNYCRFGGASFNLSRRLYSIFS